MVKELTRREMLQAAALGAGTLAGAAVPGPAEAQGTQGQGTGKLTVIQRQEYFQEAQQAFRGICQDFADAHHVSLDISTTNAESFGDFVGKLSASVRARNPPDLAYTSNVSISQLHLLNLVEDVTDIVEQAIAQYGQIMPGISADAYAKLNGRWWAVPFIANTAGAFFRGDKLKQAGIDPAKLKTWADRREAALAISDPDRGFYGWGITPNQSGDGFGALMLMINNFGGHFTDRTGQKVQFNSPETVAAYEWIAETYDRKGKYGRMLPPGIESWGDSSNNEAWLAGRIGYTHNQYSLYAQSKRDKNPVYAETLVMTMPPANNGDSRDGGQANGWLTISRGAPNLQLARQLALDLIDPRNFEKMSSVAGGLFMPAFEKQWTDELIAADPSFHIVKDQVSVANPYLGPSWPAQPNAAMDAIRAQGIVEQSVGAMIAGRATPQQAVAQAQAKMVSLFEQGGIPQR